jgi:hypothetical protein
MFAQLYVSKSKSLDNYVELFKDSARVEVFKTHCHHWCITTYVCNEILFPKRSGDTLFSGRSAHILKKGGQIILCYQTNKNKFSKIYLGKCTLDLRDPLRNKAYCRLKNFAINRLYDSLSGPAYTNLNGPISTNDHTYLPFKDYKIKVDSIFTQLYNWMIVNKDPKIDRLYGKIDSLKYMDPSTAFSLLAETDYDHFCGKYLLKQMAKQRPELLIQYIEKNNSNNRVILRTIRYHDEFKQITSNIRACPAKGKGKRKLVSQRFKRVSGDIGTGIAYTSIILVEISIIPILIIAISRN